MGVGGGPLQFSRATRLNGMLPSCIGEKTNSIQAAKTKVLSLPRERVTAPNPTCPWTGHRRSVRTQVPDHVPGEQAARSGAIRAARRKRNGGSSCGKHSRHYSPFYTSSFTLYYMHMLLGLEKNANGTQRGRNQFWLTGM